MNTLSAEEAVVGWEQLRKLHGQWSTGWGFGCEADLIVNRSNVTGSTRRPSRREDENSASLVSFCSADPRNAASVSQSRCADWTVSQPRRCADGLRQDRRNIGPSQHAFSAFTSRAHADAIRASSTDATHDNIIGASCDI